MIQHLIFDMGNVLLRFDPERILARFCKSEAESAVIRRELFEGPEWAMADTGEICDAERYDLVAPRIPEAYRPALRECVLHWHESLTPVEGALELVRDAKAAGLGVYLLTNTSDTFERSISHFGELSLFDGVVVSCFERLVKPDPAIYRLLCERFGLNPAECYFVDDRAENVEGAATVGIDGFVFGGDYAAVREALAAKGLRL